MRVNRQVHDEAETQFYAGVSLDFEISVGKVVPILEKLSPLARSRITDISMELLWWSPKVKQSSGHFFDEETLHDWVHACNYISHNLLGLRKSSFDVSLNAIPEPDKFEGTAWITAWKKIRGLRSLEQRARTLSFHRRLMRNEGDGDDAKPTDFEDDRLAMLLKYLKSEMVDGYDWRTAEEEWDYSCW